MGLIRAAVSAVGGSLADQWLEVVQAEDMDNSTILVRGITVPTGSKRSRKASANVISNGSTIYVEENQCMILTDGGNIVDYSAEPGYYTVQASSSPSLFNGQFGDALKDTFSRIKTGGGTSGKQEVFYINLQEIRDIPFGTPSPLNYFDQFYNAELFLRANGFYSIRVSNPLKFYGEMGTRDGARITIDSFQKSCWSEFLTAFQTSITEMSAQGMRISHVGAKSIELAKEMAEVLDADWEQRRGMQIESVGINSIS